MRAEVAFELAEHFSDTGHVCPEAVAEEIYYDLIFQQHLDDDDPLPRLRDGGETTEAVWEGNKVRFTRELRGYRIKLV